jgi:hypothetical protein
MVIERRRHSPNGTPVAGLDVGDVIRTEIDTIGTMQNTCTRS